MSRALALRQSAQIKELWGVVGLYNISGEATSN